MILPKRIRSWNLFKKSTKPDALEENHVGVGVSSSIGLHRHSIVSTSSTSVISPLYNRCAMDIAGLNIQHVRVDENGNFTETIDSTLNRCLSISANVDQTGHAFIQDLVYSLFDEGVVAIVPVDTTRDMYDSTIFDILTMRIGKIVEWFPYHVRVNLYNEAFSRHQEILLPKDKVGIVENPLYAIMNEPNSTLKRLVNKLHLLDAIDEQSGSGQLDLIIQLPYAIKSESRQKLADERLAAIEAQLTDSKHGIAYIDGTEKVIQLNRPAVNNLMEQVEYLTRMLYSQLGLSEALFNGTASPEEFVNYYHRTIGPVADAIVAEMKRKFLSQTAITQGQSIAYYRNPLRMVTASELAELSDKLSRNEIVTGNELRAVIGYKPSKDPGADELRNKNISAAAMPDSKSEEKNQNDSDL